MLELLIGVLLLTPICGAAVSGTAKRRAILPSVCLVWLGVVLAWFSYYAVLDFTGASWSEKQDAFYSADRFKIGVQPYAFLFSYHLTPLSIGVLSTIGLVGVIESSRVQRSREILLTCLAMVCLGAALVTKSVLITLASWILLDLIGGFFLPVNGLQATNQTRFIGQVLLRALPSLILACDALHTITNDRVIFSSWVVQIAALVRLGLVAVTHSAHRNTSDDSNWRSSGDRKDGQLEPRRAVSQSTARSSESSIFTLLCYGLPAVSVLADISAIHSTVAYGLAIFVVAAGYSALTNASRERSVLIYLQLAILAFASTKFMTNVPEFVIASQVPTLCVLAELVRRRTVLSSSIPITICALILVSGVWGQNQVYRALNDNVALIYNGGLPPFGLIAMSNPTPILIGYAIGGFLYCAAITHWVTIRRMELDPNPSETAESPTPRKLYFVTGVVGIMVPVIVLAPTFFRGVWPRYDYTITHFHDIVGPTYLTPMLGLGALLGWYFTHPARSIGDAIARWTRPVSNVAREGWYIRPILEYALAGPIRLLSFLAAQLDSRVVGGRSENAWKSSVADVGESLEGMQRLDVRYSTLCGVLAVVGVLLALWMGV